MFCPHCGKDTAAAPANLTGCAPAVGNAQPTIATLTFDVGAGSGFYSNVAVAKVHATLLAASVCSGALPGNNPTYIIF